MSLEHLFALENKETINTQNNTQVITFYKVKFN